MASNKKEDSLESILKFLEQENAVPVHKPQEEDEDMEFLFSDDFLKRMEDLDPGEVPPTQVTAGN